MSISLYQQYHKKLRVAGDGSRRSGWTTTHYRPGTPHREYSCPTYEHITLSAIPQETESGSETVVDGRAGLLTHYRPDTPHREYLLSKTRAYHSISNTTRTASGSETVVDGRAGLLTHYRLGTPHREYLLSTV
ncbi:hypothetical protein J6590_013559 [Homalodisca vitripennis]|nr:hypothetical protein J6590_013559 [Homalodisca vitripennis]